MSVGGSGGSLPHSIHPSHQHLRGAGLRHDQHHNQQGSSLLHVENVHQIESMPNPSQMATPNQMEKPSVAHMDHLSNDGMITSANTASPPNHIRNMLLSQHHQQSSKSGGGVISGGNPILMGHQSPVPSSHGMNTPSLGGDMHPSLSSRSEHPHSSSSSGILHAQTPMSPVTPPSENPPSVHSYGGWSYPHHQHAVIIGNDSYSHSLPLLPAMQANTPTTQNHTFFKASF